jgi:uncharacterized protein YndB with AHSA1/START domain
MRKPVGLTKDVGWQFGIRKTFPRTAVELWDFLLSKKTTDVWLGKIRSMKWEVDTNFTTSKGDEGVITVLKPNSHLRMRWKQDGKAQYSALQVRVIKGVGRATLSFHVDKLANEKHREAMKKHWKEIMDELEALEKKSKL